MPELVGHRSETQGWVWVPLCGAGGWNRWSLWFLLAQVPSSSGCCVRLELDMQAVMKFGFSQNEWFNVICCYWMALLTRKNKRGTSSMSAALSSKHTVGLKDTQADFKAEYHTVTVTIFSVLSLRIWSSFCPWGLFMLPASANCTRSYKVIHSFGKRKTNSLSYEIKHPVYNGLFMLVVLKLKQKL